MSDPDRRRNHFEEANRTASKHCDNIARFYGVAGNQAYPAPGSNGPAQNLYDNHRTYQDRVNAPPVEGSDSWPDGPDPTTSRTVR